MDETLLVDFLEAATYLLHQEQSKRLIKRPLLVLCLVLIKITIIHIFHDYIDMILCLDQIIIHLDDVWMIERFQDVEFLLDYFNHLFIVVLHLFFIYLFYCVVLLLIWLIMPDCLVDGSK